MSPGEIDPEVTRFVLEHLDSVSHLEALLLMWQSGSTWTVGQLAARLYVSEAKARSILDDLRRRNFIAADSDNAFSFDRQWDPQSRMMMLLGDAHRKQLIQITTLIHSKGSASVREFARAFQLKKE